MPRGPRSTPPGQHLPVLLEEVLQLLAPESGKILVDCTTGWAGHTAELLRRVGTSGKVIGLDLDPANLPRARERLQVLGMPFSLHHANFAGLPTLLASEGIEAVDGILADLGMSSMQVDEPGRGFSYRRDGPLDMRMDPTRGRTAAQLLATLPQAEIARALRELGDEPHAMLFAAAIVEARKREPLETTGQLAGLLMQAAPGKDNKNWRLHPNKGKWNLHPAARTFQALRILVNRELANLEQLLRVLPDLLRPRGVAAIISFHSGEDRLVKAAFREGLKRGVYEAIADEPIRAGEEEKRANPRSRSAKLRWARRR